MENIVYQFFIILCHPNEQNFTQLIAVTFTTLRPFARISQQGVKNHKGTHLLNAILNVCSNQHEKSRLRHVNFIRIQTRPRKLYRYECQTSQAPPFVLLQLGQGKRQEIAYFANRWNFYLFVDCSRVSPLSPRPLSYRTSYRVSGVSL